MLDWRTADFNLEPPQPDHCGRAKYRGFHGARNWLRITESDWYGELAQPSEVAQKCAGLVKESELRPKTFLSLGPGNAESDLILYNALLPVAPDLKYVPVDLSPGLLITAARKLTDGDAQIPFGLLADFEDRTSFVFEAIKDCEEPILIGLLGNTFGNLDTNDMKFASNLGRLMRDRHTALLVHVNVIRDYQPDKDSLVTGKLPTEAKECLARAVVDCHPKKIDRNGKSTGFEFSDVIENFEDRVPMTNDTGPRVLDGLESVTIDFVPFGKTNPVLRVRRFNLDSLRNWLPECGIQPIMTESDFSRPWQFNEAGVGHAVLMCESCEPREHRSTDRGK